MGKKVVEVMQGSTGSLKAGTVRVKDKKRNLEKFGASELSDVRMIYYREPMPGKGVFHDFLLLHGGSGDPDSQLGGVRLYIKAEKIYVAGGRGQINISIKQGQPDYGGCGTAFDVQFNDCGKLTLNELVHALEDHPKHYFLLEGNCWKYASDIFKNVMKKFINHQDTSEQARDRLNKFLAEAEPKFPILPMSYFDNALNIGIALTPVFLSGIASVLLHFQYPTDVIVGNSVIAAIDALAHALCQQATPVGLPVPLVCAATGLQKLGRALKRWRTTRLGREFVPNPALAGTFVRILSIKYILPASAIAAILALLIGIVYFLFKCWNIYRDNRWKRER